MDKFFSTICIAALASYTIIGCKPKAPQTKMPLQTIEVTKALSAPIYNTIEVSSKISSLYSVTIQPRVNGFLTSIDYSEGLPVKKGALLFTIDPNSYNIDLYSAKANLESAQAKEILANNNYQRAVPLAAIDAISQSDLDQYRAEYSASKAEVKTAIEALNRAELNLSYTTITSPIDGIVANTPANEGDYIGPATQFSTLTQISYIDTVQVEISIPTSVYLSNKDSYSNNSYDNSDLLSDITLTLAGGVTYPFQGMYDYTKKDAPDNSSTVVIVVKFPNPNYTLKSGMYAKVTANIGKPKDRVLVPQIAVSQMQGINSVWVISPDSIAKVKKVELGKTYNQMWIVDSGIKEGETVAISGQLKIHNGAKVKPIFKR